MSLAFYLCTFLFPLLLSSLGMIHPPFRLCFPSARKASSRFSAFVIPGPSCIHSRHHGAPWPWVWSRAHASPTLADPIPITDHAKPNLKDIFFSFFLTSLLPMAAPSNFQRGDFAISNPTAFPFFLYFFRLKFVFPNFIFSISTSHPSLAT